ncbi:hypothetical protein Tsubulata_012303 [Turnera subulata]|uniref:KIB1-4 beta-propeller domain-containing protein n=1 Tax=Turnera subulata TaxID=218843 RepID=A0A9Q0GLF0_9ROSI|nr:hypothetical protein Tsubulata_012303 [Turnera subulata]
MDIAALKPWMMLQEHGSSKSKSFFDLCSGDVHKLKLPRPLQGEVFCCGSSKGWFIMGQEISEPLPYLLSSFICQSYGDAYFAEEEANKWCPAICRYFKRKIQFWWASKSFESRVILFNPASRVLLPLPLVSTIPFYQSFLWYIHPDYHASYFFHKIELSSADTSNCVVAALVNDLETTWRRVLVFCKPGETRWSITLGDREELEYADILFHKGTLCALTLSGNDHVEDHIFKVGESEVSVKLIPDLSRRRDYNPGLPEYLPGEEILVYRDGHFHSYLVESTRGALLMIVKNANVLENEVVPDFEYIKTSGFVVFRIDPDSGNLHELNSLEEEVVFLSYGGSFSLSAQDLPGVRGNCIFFSENYDCFDHYDNPTDSRENGVYYLDTETIQRPFPSLKLPLQSRLSWFLPNSVVGKSNFN